MPETFQPKPFRKKTPEELRAQLDEASRLLGEPIAPPSDQEAVLHATTEELQRQFPKRFEVYTMLLRSIRGRGRGGPELDPHELDRLRHWFRMMNHLDAYAEAHRQNETERTLRERQFTVFEDTRRTLEEGRLSGYVKLPTGTGKTVIFSEFVEALQVPTLIVVPTVDLVDQTQERLATFAPQLAVGAVYGERKEWGATVTVTTYASFVRQTKDGQLDPTSFDCVILDEAHHALAPQARAALGRYAHALRIGFTATPDYAEDRQLRDLLGDPIHELSIVEAVQDGALSPFRVELVRTEVDLSSVPVTAGDYNEKDLRKAIDVAARNRAAAQLYRERFNGKLAVVYCLDIEHSEHVAEEFRALGIPAAAYHSGLSMDERRRLLQQFRSGELRVLCNPFALAEGFDEPRAEVCLNLRPTTSRVMAEQRGGRVLRLDPSNPLKEAMIVDFLDRDARHRAVTFADVAQCAAVRPHAAPDGVGERGGGTQQPPPHIEGIEVIVESDLVLRITQERAAERERLAPPPEGWLTQPALAARLGVTVEALRSLVAALRPVLPEWFRERHDRAGRVTIFCAPEFATIAVECATTPQAEGGTWWPLSSLAPILGCSHGDVRRAVYGAIRDHRSWLRLTFGDRRCDEEIAGAFAEQLARTHGREEAFEGARLERQYRALIGAEWQLREDVLRAHPALTAGEVEAVQNQYASTHPDDTYEHRFAFARGERTLWSPAFIVELGAVARERVRQGPERADAPLIREGWVPMEQAAKMLGIKTDAIVAYTQNAEVYDDPAFVRRIGSHTLLEPTFVKMLELDRSELQGLGTETPGEWLSAKDVSKLLTKEFGVRGWEIRDALHGFVEKNSTWQKKDGDGTAVYAPELLDRLRRKFQHRPRRW